MQHFIALLLVIICSIMATQVSADVFEKIYPEEYSQDINKNYELTEEEWQENKTLLPPLPDGKMIKVFGAPAYANYTYSIEEDSFRVDPDGVVRYIIVIQSPAGSKNIFYEGIRCATGEYISYAFASSSDKEFVEKLEPTWKPVTAGGIMGYTEGFIRNYFCNKFGELLARREIIKNMKYGKGNVDGLYIE